MARTMTTAAVGQVNRRFLFLALILAALSAVLVYAAVSRDGGGGSSAVDVTVVVAKDAIPASTRITAEMLEVQQIPATAVGEDALRSIDAAVGRVARYPIAANEQVLLSKVVSTSAVGADGISIIIEEGQRALAIGTEQVVGAGGLVLPGDYVDVLWLPDTMQGNNQGAAVLIENVEVLAVEQTLVDIAPTAPGAQEDDTEPAASDPAQRVRGSDAEPIPDAATVTLMVTPQQAQLIFCAEGHGSLRLAVRAFGDATTSGIAPVLCPPPAPSEEEPQL